MYRFLVPVLLLLSAAPLWSQQTERQQGRHRTFQPRRMERFRNFPETPPAVGTEAPDFVLPTLDGKDVRLSSFRNTRYVVLEFGSYT